MSLRVRFSREYARAAVVLTVPLAFIAIGLALSQLAVDSQENLFVITCCLLGVSPVILFHIYRRDMMARDKVERALEESEQRYRRLVELSPNAIGVCRNGKILYGNDSLKRLLGARTVKALEGKPLDGFVAPESRTNVRERLEEVGERGHETVSMEQKMSRLDGGEVDVEVTALPFFYEEQKAVQLIARDITEHKRVEEAIRRAQGKAEAATRAKSEFLANMSHEIRTPINGVLGMMEVVLGTKLTSRQREWLVMAKSSGESLLSLLNDMLDFSKIEAGKLDLIQSEFSPRECAELAIGTLATQAQDKGLSLDCQVGPDVPERVIGDSSRLRQIMLNLLGNAIKFTDQGGVTLAVQVESETPANVLLRFSVQDTGIGIAKSEREWIFEKFRQADGSSTRQHGGTGLGLAISTHLTTLMQGRIWVESELGKGSTFHFTAKLDRVVCQEPPAAPMGSQLANLAAAVAEEQTSTAPLRVLLAEDNIVNQKLTMELIRRLGHEVTVVSNGAEAVAVARDRAFDCIFMDVQMPVMDGFEATGAIRVAQAMTGRHVPIIALTAHAMKGDQEKCRHAGMDDYLSKPTNPAGLREKLDKWGARNGRAEEETPPAAPEPPSSETEKEQGAIR
ncbi:MAG: response regulator [bacterium]|nr:response regulator [bacterium]